jgi:hypothetical protein
MHVLSLIIAALFSLFGHSPTFGDGGISTLDQWAATTSPSAAITQRTYGKAVRITGLSNSATVCTSASGILTTSGCSAGSGFATTSADYWIGTYDKGFFFSTTSANQWITTKSTTNLPEGSNLYYTDARARAALSSSATGLTYTSASGIFSLTSGYVIPLSASTTDWAAFRDTPSTRITAGTNLSWSGNTLNGAADSHYTGLFSGTYPVQYSAGAFSLAFGTTTSNTWGGAQTFTNAPVFSSLSGLLKGNGSSAITAAAAGTDYEVPLTFSTGLTRTTNTITVNTSQNIAKLSNLTSNGFVKTSGGDGTLSIDTGTYLSGTVAIANGGTATTTQITNGVNYFDGTRITSKTGFTFNGTTFTAGSASTTLLSIPTAIWIPNSSSQSPTSAGQLALDTTDDQLKVGDGSTTAVFDQRRFFTLSYSTTTAWTGTTTVALGTAPAAVTLKSVQCYTDAGTLNVQWKYGSGPTNVTPLLNASTTIGTVTFTGSNTPAAGNAFKVDIGTPASSPTSISCTITALVAGT